ncbi:MAG TPA: hypothetical protein VIB79_31470 [Candidatus Binatia bacterium]
MAIISGEAIVTATSGFSPERVGALAFDLRRGGQWSACDLIS